MTPDEFLEELQRFVNKHGGPTLAAKQLQMSQGYLTRILARERPVNAATARKMGYEQIVRYEPMGGTCEVPWMPTCPKCSSTRVMKLSRPMVAEEFVCRDCHKGFVRPPRAWVNPATGGEIKGRR